jgi:glycosyltransferase involved in cell wall biosynthesis
LAHLVNDLITHAWLKKQCPDIVHATYYSPPKRKGSKAKVVVTVHDMIHELYPDDFVSYDHTAQLKHDAVMSSDHVICVSNNTKKDLIRLTGIDPNKVSVVHHGVNRITPVPETKFKLPDKPYLLYVGKRGGYKNYSGLLSAFASSYEINTRFNLVCFGLDVSNDS